MRKRTPRQVRDPMACVTQRMPLTDDQQRDLCIAYRIQLQAMLRGSGTEETWNTLTCSLNIALILCEQGIGANAIQTIQLAQEALLACRERARRLSRWAFSGDEARMVMSACSIHDEQLEFATRAQVVSALTEVHRRIEIGETV
ncbi:MAG: hypothetical protein HKM00_09630 [Gallionella sp.]|nr:hypothetical protein [Gallionella sp.]